MKEEGSTYFARAQADEVPLGRFAVLGTPHIVGTGAPPVAGGQRDVVGDEPPLPPDENPAFELEPQMPSPVVAQETPDPRLGQGSLPNPASVDPSPVPLADVERHGAGLGPSRAYRRY
jgi:hypothetical protein